MIHHLKNGDFVVSRGIYGLVRIVKGRDPVINAVPNIVYTVYPNINLDIAREYAKAVCLKSGDVVQFEDGMCYRTSVHIGLNRPRIGLIKMHEQETQI